MKPPKTYIDTTVLKFSATQLPRFQPTKQKLNWGGHVYEVIVNHPVDQNPNSSIGNSELKAETELLSDLAEACKRGQVSYVIQMEALLESWGLPNMDSATGRFYGAPCETVDAPIRYGRVVFGGLDGPKDMQFDFLANIKSKRFIELQKMTGAYQGNLGINRNQLLDAFHLLCAEFNECDYFLTLDFKLIRMLRNRRSSPLRTE